MFTDKEILKIIDRDSALFTKDVELHNEKLKDEISHSSFLVIGGAGSIGREVTKQILKRDPKLIHTS